MTSSFEEEHGSHVLRGPADPIVRYSIVLPLCVALAGAWRPRPAFRLPNFSTDQLYWNCGIAFS